jgi:retron-type reverse transcriptase
MKQAQTIKNMSNEIYSRVREGRHLSNTYPFKNGLKQGYALSPLIVNFALEYAIRRVQINLDGLKLNGTHKLLVYDDDVNIMREEHILQGLSIKFANSSR